MKTNYILIDYENVQPKNLSLLAEERFRVKVFIGPNLTRIPIELATAMQSLGSRAEYIRVSGQGSNALDFHIAYYIGRLAATDAKAFFHIISKDTGFDPLIVHLKGQGILSARSGSLDGMPILKGLTGASSVDQVDAVIAKLRGMPKSRPQRDKTLRTMIAAWFAKSLDEAAIGQIVSELQKRKLIAFDGAKVSYSLPS